MYTDTHTYLGTYVYTYTRTYLQTYEGNSGEIYGTD